jgi:serine/threonine protein kinase
MTLSPGTRLGPYEIVGLLGVGGMGEVYRARDTQLKRDVALKVLPTDVAADPERLARFRREAELLAALNHPHICTLYGLGEAFPASPESRAPSPASFLVLELVDGPTLPGSRFKPGKPTPLFADPYLLASYVSATYDVSPDGQRFLMVKPVVDPASVTQVHVIAGWFVELKARVPVK